MNKKQAYSLGIDSGLETAQYGDFSESARADHDLFMQEGSEMLENKRQYADSPTYDFAREPNSDSLFDAFDAGETIGLIRGWRQWFASEAIARQAAQDASAEIESGECATIDAGCRVRRKQAPHTAGRRGTSCPFHRLPIVRTVTPNPSLRWFSLPVCPLPALTVANVTTCHCNALQPCVCVANAVAVNVGK